MRPGDTRWDRYHAGLYAYPTGYPPNVNDVPSQIFGVNLGHLSVWWWNPTALVEKEQFPFPIYWPSLVCDYRNEWPEGGSQIVIASFQGSAYGGYLNDGTASLLFTQGPVAVQGKSTVTNDLPNGWGNPLYDQGFTFETWINPATISGYRGLMAMRCSDGSNVLSFFVKDGNLGASLITYGEGAVATQEWSGDEPVQSNEWAHVAMSYGAAGGLHFYVNGQPAGAAADVPPGLGGYMANSVDLGVVRSWTPTGDSTNFGTFQGWMDETRMWAEERTPADVLSRYAVSIDENSNPGLIFRFDYATNRLYATTSPLDRTGLFYVTGVQAGRVELDAPNVVLRRAGTTYAGQGANIYYQNNAAAAGYNPNEEHALALGSFVYALRCDLNITNVNETHTSRPFTLVEYSPTPGDWHRGLDVYEVVATNAHFPRFLQNIEAGRMIQPPAPLRSVLPDNCLNTYVEPAHTNYIFRDRLDYYWAKQAHKSGAKLDVVMRFFYPMQIGFWIPQLGNQQLPPTTEVPWLSAFEANDQSPEVITGGTPVRLTFKIQWPEIVPTLSICDTLTKPKYNLPAVRGQKSVRLVYQQSLDRYGSAHESAVLIDPTRARKVTLTNVPPKMRAMRDPRSGNTFFSDLDPDLRERLFFVPMASATNRLNLKGLFVERETYDYLRLNLMTPDLITNALNPTRMVGIDESWTNAINALPTERITMTDENAFFDTLALCTPGFGAGYVTLIFNNSTNIDMVDPGDPISMKVIRIQTNLFKGKIDIIQSSNPLDKYMTLRHISDFSGVPQNWSFDWQYARPENGVAPSMDDTNKWRYLPGGVDVPGRYTTIFGSSGEFGLADAYVRCRYRALDEQIGTLVGTNFGGWTDPVLCEGWIKRVLKAINPFDQRIRDYMNYALNMDLSMIQQAGQPYAGDIPLNLDAMNEYGLIPIYQTVLEQSRGLSIDSTLDYMPTEEVVCLALMLAAGRLNDLYMVLGNEAYADALNPIVSLGNDDPVLSADATSIFAFQRHRAQPARGGAGPPARPGLLGALNPPYDRVSHL